MTKSHNHTNQYVANQDDTMTTIKIVNLFLGAKFDKTFDRFDCFNLYKSVDFMIMHWVTNILKWVLD